MKSIRVNVVKLSLKKIICRDHTIHLMSDSLVDFESLRSICSLVCVHLDRVIYNKASPFTPDHERLEGDNSPDHSSSRSFLPSFLPHRVLSLTVCPSCVSSPACCTGRSSSHLRSLILSCQSQGLKRQPVCRSFPVLLFLTQSVNKYCTESKWKKERREISR